MKKYRYTARHRAMIKKHIKTMLKASTSEFWTADEAELYAVTYNALNAECRAFGKATGMQLGLPEFMKLFIAQA